MVIADYHTHSIYSIDGKSTIEENIKVAVDKGLKQIAIAEHCYGHIRGIKNGDFVKIKNEIAMLRNKYPQIDIIFGMEVDVLDDLGNIDITEDELKQLDIVILGFHKNCRSFKHWINHMKMRFLKTKKQIQKNTESYIKVMEKYKIDILAHLNYGCKIDLEKIIDYIKDKKILIELNGKRILFNKNEIALLKKSDVLFVANSDAHNKFDVGSNNRAVNFMIKNKISNDKLVNWNKIADFNISYERDLKEYEKLKDKEDDLPEIFRKRKTF